MTDAQTKETTSMIEVLQDADLFDALRDEWDDLLHRSVTDTIFGTWAWNKHWWDAYHPGKLWVMVVRDADQRLLGIAPWFIDESDPDAPVLRCIGCEDVTDYVDLLVDADHVDQVYDRIAQYLHENGDAFTAIEICNIPQASPTKTRFAQSLEAVGYTVAVNQRDVCPVIPLPDSWDAYLANLDKKQRHEIRRKLRRAEGQRKMGGLDWYTVDDSHDLNAEIERFLGLMATASEEKARFLENPQHVAFFKAIVPSLYAAGLVRMIFITMNDSDTVAAYLNFDYHNRKLVYNSGLDTSRHAHLSPGIVLLSFDIQKAIEDGFEAYDFLRGDENYKYRMGGQDTAVYTLRAGL